MRAVWRFLLRSLATIGAVPLFAADSVERPPIFAPRAARPAATAPAVPKVTSPPAPLSDYLRRALTETVLANARAFAAPPSSAAGEAAAATYPVTSDGALLMPRFVVRSPVPEKKEVLPPPVALYRFTRMERLDRQRNGLSANLWASRDGLKTFELNVVNGAGFGVDHNIDFTRVELGFRMRF